MTTLCVLGRQPELGRAELEALYGTDKVRALGVSCATVEGPIDFQRLGGTVKAGIVLDTLPGTNWKKAFHYLAHQLPHLLTDVPNEGKIKLGASLYGFSATAYEINGEVLRLKKQLRQLDRSARAVPNETPELSSAQTYHNSLTKELGLEFAIVKTENSLVVARITDVQDIDSYRIRDRERPKRDAFVGMLPPKLAQIIINLATGPTKDGTVLDPFCGTGVILQEAALMGYDVYGTDIAQKMVEYTLQNLAWLREKTCTPQHEKVEAGDATSLKWSKFSFVACEGYLGQPLGGQRPSEEKVREIIHDTNNVMRGFLKNIAGQTPSGTRFCVAMPAWYIDEKLYHLPVLTELEALGYEKIGFAAAKSLIYRREDQVTARELVVFTKK